ncbi:hypothetical protein E2C01_009605 [Portunus trituberculatus]|uniref:Uncharacterized protein n=1 Tax=Portunus trituberculatus TaxID=210409 RepID=A0A5B7D681_PORTR|nr:hypothetical protein [Portunus trituberculatus]
MMTLLLLLLLMMMIIIIIIITITIIIIIIITIIPSWLINAPEWFEEKPWWFEMAPPWYHTPPAWLKPNVLTEQIQVEAGPGLEVQKPDQIIKNVGVPIQSSPDEKDAPVYHDNKTLR